MPLMSKMAARIDRRGDDIPAGSTSAKVTLDGVLKASYGKFGDLLAEVKAVWGGEEAGKWGGGSTAVTDSVAVSQRLNFLLFAMEI